MAVEEVGIGIHHVAEEVGTGQVSAGTYHVAVEEVGAEQMLAGDYCVTVEEVSTVLI